MNLLGVLEGILFVVGDEGVTLTQICDILSVDIEEAKRNASSIVHEALVTAQKTEIEANLLKKKIMV